MVVKEKLYNRPSKKRVTVKQCTNCKTLLSRDTSAACIILDIFEYQRKHMTRELPTIFYSNNNNESLSILIYFDAIIMIQTLE